MRIVTLMCGFLRTLNRRNSPGDGATCNNKAQMIGAALQGATESVGRHFALLVVGAAT